MDDLLFADQLQAGMRYRVAYAEGGQLDNAISHC